MIRTVFFSSWPGIAVRRTASLPLAYVPAIPVFLVSLPQRRGCPGQAPGMTVLAILLAPFRVRLSGQARQVELMLPGAVDRDVVAGIGMTHHAAGRVVPQYATDPSRGLWRAVADDHHAGV